MSWGLFDQALSSLALALFVFACARVSPVAAFGQVTLILAAFNVVLATLRGFLGSRIVLLAGDDQGIEAESAYAVIVGASTGGLVTVALIAMVLAGSLDSWAVWIALAAPLVLAQDVLRFAATARGRPQTACISDGAWALGCFILLVFCWTGLVSRLGVVTLTWAVLAALALALAHAGPRSSRARTHRTWRRWFSTHSRQRIEFGGEALLAAITTAAVLYIAALLVSLDASAALRGSASLFAPVIVFVQAIPLIVVPELRLRGLGEPGRLWHFLIRLALPTSLSSLLMGIVLWFLPSSLGRLLLGDTWHLAHHLVLITAVDYALVAWWSTVNGVLRSVGDSRGVLINRMVFSGAAFVLTMPAAALTDQALPVAVALGCSTAIALVWSGTRLRRVPAGRRDAIGTRTEASREGSVS